MGDTDIVPNVDAPTVVEVTSEIDDRIHTHTHLTNMEELASTMNARFTPPDSYSEHTQIAVAQRVRHELVRNIQKFHQ